MIGDLNGPQNRPEFHEETNQLTVWGSEPRFLRRAARSPSPYQMRQLLHFNKNLKYAIITSIELRMVGSQTGKDLEGRGSEVIVVLF
jgi:hypothetical protein